MEVLKICATLDNLFIHLCTFREGAPETVLPFIPFLLEYRSLLLAMQTLDEQGYSSTRNFSKEAQSAPSSIGGGLDAGPLALANYTRS